MEVSLKDVKTDRQVLFALAGGDKPITMAQLYQALPHILPTTIRYNVKQLIKRGLVTRTGNARSTREAACKYGVTQP